MPTKVLTSTVIEGGAATGRRERATNNSLPKKISPYTLLPYFFVCLIVYLIVYRSTFNDFFAYRFIFHFSSFYAEKKKNKFSASLLSHV